VQPLEHLNKRILTKRNGRLTRPAVFLPWGNSQLSPRDK
jgi:hypothetical protein